MLRLLLLTALLTGCSGPGTSQDPPSRRAVEARFADLLAAASAPDVSVESFAPFLVARGDDASRQWKVAADPSRPAERAYAASVLDTVRGILADVQGPAGGVEYEVLEFVVEPESEGVWHVLSVDFATPQGPQEYLFAFLPLGNTYLLGDIES